MTDFYSLLRQSILDRGIRDAAEREEVYRQARQAVIKQLWDFHPPLAADEIDTRVGAYDKAVERIEADIVATFAAKDAPVEAPSTAELPPLPVPDAEDEEIFEPQALEDDDVPPLVDWADDEDEDAAVIASEPDAADEYELEDAAIGEADDPGAGDAPYDDEADEEDEEPSVGVERAAIPFRPADHPHVGHEEEAAPIGATAAAAAAASRALQRKAQEQQLAKREWHRRWTPAGDSKVIVAQARKWWSLADDKYKIQILGGAIAGLVLVLGVIAAFLMFSPRGQSITVAIDGPRTVSDAATATRLASEKFDVVQTYSLFDGRDPTVFVTTPENPVRFDSQGGFVRISSSVSSPGVKALIGPGLASRLAGQRLRVTLVVRSAPEQGAGSLRFAYQSGVALSHWQTANVTETYEEVAMIWRLPAMRTGATGDFVLIEPGIPGDGTSIDVQSIRIDVLPPETG